MPVFFLRSNVTSFIFPSHAVQKGAAISHGRIAFSFILTSTRQKVNICRRLVFSKQSGYTYHEVSNLEFIYEKERIYSLDENGRLIAEITFPARGGDAVIDHTFTDPSLRGQGVADRLVRAAVKEIKARGLTPRATCSYAARWFERHPEEI
ncbi:MAG: N-acetyltransferase [Clostridia bacterium]|nr:N-acetyltransferase [Clostridia bacterium]